MNKGIFYIFYFSIVEKQNSGFINTITMPEHQTLASLVHGSSGSVTKTTMSYTSAIITSGRGPNAVGGSAPPGGSFAAKLTNSVQEHLAVHPLPSAIISSSGSATRPVRGQTLSVLLLCLLFSNRNCI